MSDYAAHLFSYLPPGRLETFSFGHVIPPENLIAQTMPKGILGSEFNFTFEARNSENMESYKPPATPVCLKAFKF
jgi:chromosome transmission fidelity protein 1